MNHRNVKWAFCAALVLIMGLSLFWFTPGVLARSDGPSASKLYKQGQQAEARDDIEGAYEFYYQAYQKKPEDIGYKAAWERTRFTAATLHVKHGETLRDQGDVTGALTEFLRALQIDPSNELATQEIQATRRESAAKAAKQSAKASVDTNGEPIPRGEAAAMGEMGGPIHLKPLSDEPLTIHAVEDSKVVYQTVGKMAGINVLFDPDYTSKRVQVDLENTDLYDALRIIGVVSGTFWQPVTRNTIFVAQNTRAKRTELQNQAVQTFYLTNVSQQNDFTDIQTALRNMFQTAKIYGVASQDAIIMRGTPDELLLAQKLIDDLDKAKPEVVVDVAVLEVSKNWERNIGIQLPQTATVGFQASNYNVTNTGGSSTTDQNGNTGTPANTGNGLTLNSFAHLNGTNFAVSIGQAQANLLLTNSSTKILQNPRIRASDGQEATLKIGEKIPIATGSYQTGAATAIVSSLVNTQFQYLDVGVKIKIKPTVHYDRDVTLALSIEVSTQNGSTNIGGITEPIISQRTVDQTIRLKEGEANILGGILQKQTSNTESGVPGLAKLPILKYIFGDNDKTSRDDQIVFLLIPHVVRAEMLDPMNLRQVDTGTANNIELRHTNTETASPAAAAQTESPAMLGAPGNGAAAPTAPAAKAAAGAAEEAAANMQASGTVRLNLAPEIQQAKVGSTFQVKVNLAGGKDVFSVPMQLQYDQTKLSLINVDLGDSGGANGMDFLGKDGQAVALVHRDDGQGNVAISASRPPGARGVDGAGTVCVLTFKAKAPGPAAVVVTKPVVRNSAQQAEPAVGSRAIVQVQP